MTVELPENLPSGAFELYVSNGDESDYSWSKEAGISVSIDPRFHHDWSGSDHLVLDVADYGAIAGDASDDTTAIRAALETARIEISRNSDISEVTVALGLGTYDISGTLDLHDGVNLSGLGAQATTISVSPEFVVAGSKNVISSGFTATRETASGSRLGDLAIDTHDLSDLKVIMGRNSKHFSIEDVEISSFNSKPFDVHNSYHFSISGSEITGTSSFIGASDHISIKNNEFHGTNQATSLVHGFGSSEVNFSGNTARHFDANPTSDTWATDAFQGRFFVEQPHYEQPIHQYIANNQTYDLAPHVEFRSEGLHANAGEQILYEGAGTSARLELGSFLLVIQRRFNGPLN